MTGAALSIPRLALGALSAGALLGAALWAWGPTVVRAPGQVTASREYRVEHQGDGTVRWQVLDGAVAGGPAVTAEGVLLAERMSPLDLALAEGVSPGAAVAAGQAVVRVSAPAQQAAADAWTQQQAAASADRDALAQGGRAGDVQAARAEIKVAEANLARAEQQAAVLQRLVDQGAGSAWEAELAALEVEVQQRALGAARARVAQAINQPWDAEVEAADARAEAAAARVEEARHRALPDALTAPFAGTVAASIAPVLLSVQAPGPALVQLALPERAAGRVDAGAALTFVDTATGASVPGALVAISSDAVVGPSGPAVWALAQLDAPVRVGATGVAKVEARPW